MNTPVYVDVLLVINYIINFLLILCTAKILGNKPRRRKIVAAALFGSLCSLTIFLPFMGFFYELFSKVLLSAAIVRIALSWNGWGGFVRQWFVFFAVSFFFAGVMLGVWMLFAPGWLFYYNGIVYFNVSTVALLATTVLAYLLLAAVGRLSRAGRLQGTLCKVQVYLGGRMCGMTGLVDTGNGLREPFSGAPVMVCSLADVAPLLSQQVQQALREGIFGHTQLDDLGMQFRLVPYSSVGKTGVLPAFIPDRLILQDDRGTHLVEQVYVAVSTQKVGDSRYSAILNPDMIGAKLVNGGAVR